MSAHNAGRRAYMLATLLLCAYALNVLTGKGAASFGWQLPHAGDVAEFLSVLAAMVFFVAGLFLDEAAAASPKP